MRRLALLLALSPALPLAASPKTGAGSAAGGLPAARGAVPVAPLPQPGARPLPPAAVQEIAAPPASPAPLELALPPPAIDEGLRPAEASAAEGPLAADAGADDPSALPALSALQRLAPAGSEGPEDHRDAEARAEGFFDRSAHPSGASRAIELLLSEHPALERRIDERLELAGLAAALPKGWWRSSLPELLRGLWGVRAGALGKTPAGYEALLAGDTREAKAERQGLAAYLSERGSHRAEDWTYIFRDHPLWKEPLERFLEGLIARRRGSRRIDIDSVGTGYGSEPYSLAITVARALERAGEDPAAWKVRIRTHDLSLASLFAAKRGLYRPRERDRFTFDELGLARYFEPAGAGLLRLKAGLRDWIEPVYADLEDERQHVLLSKAPDVVFANYLLFHLRKDPATALAERWLAGDWSEHGFLSMAQVLVAEVGASRLAPKRVRLFSGYSGNVGNAGAMFYGDDYRAPLTPRQALRGMWRDRWSAASRQAKASGLQLLGMLAGEPRQAVPVDAGMLDFLAAEAKAAGLEPVLTLEELSVRVDAAGGRLYANAGWLLPPMDAAAWRSEFSRRLALELTSAGARSARGPPLAKAIRHPEMGRGAVVMTGRLPGGAVLRAGRFQTGAALFWLTSRLVPITEAYVSDNAAKPPEKLERERAVDRSLYPRGVIGLH
ncbi:MAG: hypothetical protein HY554_11785 [Elusimicrobia bacterium]|nr:hypothetical protein [Elusimicrobiota bacterium]